MIQPEKFCGKGDLCEINGFEQSFTFQRRKFVFNGTAFTLPTHDYPVDIRGLTKIQYEERQSLHGMNALDVAVPTFVELMQEQVVAPFFVFQLFCVALWFLDDMYFVCESVIEGGITRCLRFSCCLCLNRLLYSRYLFNML